MLLEDVQSAPSSANCDVWILSGIFSNRSSIIMLNSVGDMMLPWGVPLSRVLLLCTTPFPKVDCDCGESYIGETSRPISTRIKEHKTSTEKSDNKSAISDHILAHPHHKIQWTETTLLARNQTDFTKRKLTEAIHIKRYKPSINRDQGYHIPSAYDHIINQSR